MAFWSICYCSPLQAHVRYIRWWHVMYHWKKTSWRWTATVTVLMFHLLCAVRIKITCAWGANTKDLLSTMRDPGVPGVRQGGEGGEGASWLKWRYKAKRRVHFLAPHWQHCYIPLDGYECGCNLVRSHFLNIPTTFSTILFSLFEAPPLLIILPLLMVLPIVRSCCNGKRDRCCSVHLTAPKMAKVETKRYAADKEVRIYVCNSPAYVYVPTASWDSLWHYSRQGTKPVSCALRRQNWLPFC